MIRTMVKIFLPLALPFLLYMVLWRISKYLCPVWLLFQELFSVLKNKKHKKLVWKKMIYFCFLCFPCSQKPLFYNNKKMFSLFFHYLNNILFFLFFLPSFCIFLDVFCIFTKVSSTQPSHPHPQSFSSF